MAGVVQCLKSHACGHGTIANNGNALAARVLLAGGDGHAQSRADRGAGMTYTKGIVFAFGALWKTGQAVLATDAAHLFTAARENLVRVSLMADIPYQAIFRCIENIVQCYSEFEHAKPGAEMATGLPDRPQQECPQLSGKLNKLVRRQLPQLGGYVNPIQQRCVWPL